jgi:hypothetical protein
MPLTRQGLKATGTYVSRTLSYGGAEFRMEQLEVDPVFRCWLADGDPSRRAGLHGVHVPPAAQPEQLAARGF